MDDGLKAHTQALMQPDANASTRFDYSPPAGKGPIDPDAVIMKQRGTPSGYTTGNDPPELAKLISEKQGQAEMRTPSLTMQIGRAHV